MDIDGPFLDVVVSVLDFFSPWRPAVCLIVGSVFALIAFVCIPNQPLNVVAALCVFIAGIVFGDRWQRSVERGW